MTKGEINAQSLLTMTKGEVNAQSLLTMTKVEINAQSLLTMTKGEIKAERLDEKPPPPSLPAKRGPKPTSGPHSCQQCSLKFASLKDVDSHMLWVCAHSPNPAFDKKWMWVWARDRGKIGVI